MNYKGTFKYGWNFDKKEKTFGNEREIPITVFFNGTKAVALSRKDDIDILAVLEQARDNKQLVLMMPPAKDHVDMEAAVELMGFAADKTPISIRFGVEKFSSRNKIQEFVFLTPDATIKGRPTITEGHLLKIELKFPAAVVKSY
jgi:hypothetical protein